MRFARRLAGGALAALLLLPLTGGPAAASSTLLTGPCLVTYTVSVWATGFSADVAVTNRSVAPPNGVVNLILDDGQRPYVWWGANTSIAGSDPHMTFTLPAFHPDVAIGETYHFGYNATYTGAYDQAYAFRLGGQLCDIEYVTL